MIQGPRLFGSKGEREREIEKRKMMMRKEGMTEGKMRRERQGEEEWIRD